MPLKGQILEKVIAYISSKLAENQSFQKLSLRTHEKIEGIHRTAEDEFLNHDPAQVSFRRLLSKLIKSGKDFLEKP